MCNDCIVFCVTGIPTNPSKPAGYSVRMESTVPLVTQAPAIQPIQIRPGVITQVRGGRGAGDGSRSVATSPNFG